MQVPRRKPGNYVYSKPDPYLTQKKVQELKNKLERMKNMHPKLAAEVRRLALDGDFSENAAYQLAKGRLRGLNQRILDTKSHLDSAIIISPPGSASLVQVGNTVEVEVNKKCKTFTILGSAETDPLRGIISRHSPIGLALLNQKVGDTVRIKIKDKEIEYKIKKIH